MEAIIESYPALYIVNLDSIQRGIDDETSIIQNDMDNLAAAGGGTLVLPAGQPHIIAGSLNIPSGVQLKGVLDYIQSYTGFTGTIIHATGYAQEPDGPPVFLLNSASSVSSLSVYYPYQIRGVEKLIPYPWTFKIEGADCTIENITLYNSYRGIKAGDRPPDQSPGVSNKNSERHRIRNVFGTVIGNGIWVDFCSDVGRIENVHFHPQYWGIVPIPGQNEAYEWVQGIVKANLTAFKFGWTDWEYVTDTSLWCADVGYHFVDSAVPPHHEGRHEMNGQLKGVGFDCVCTGFKIEKLQHMGIVVSNGQFDANGEEPRISIDISRDCSGNVRFDNCSFWGDVNQNVICKGDSFLSLSNCYISNYLNGLNLPALVSIQRGRIQITGCSFETHHNRDHIDIKERVTHAIITSNNAKDYDPEEPGGIRIRNEIGNNAIIANNELHPKI